MAQAARAAGVSYASAKAREARLKNNSGDVIREANQQAVLPAPIPLGELGPEASRALEDFGYFRARYLGRISTPWQEQAAYTAVGLMERAQSLKTREYLVVNAPPGSGKSTLWTLDIPLWVTCRRRGIRGMIASASQKLAERYLMNLRTIFESPYRIESEFDLVVAGLAVDAEATLSEDFGFFKPQPATTWSNSQIEVAQHGNKPLTRKEPTWCAYGLGSQLIGGRYDLIVLDDLVDASQVRTLERTETHRSDYDSVIEKRIDPGGLVVLNGQRLSPEDIYRYCIDKTAGETASINHVEAGCCEAEEGKKYHLIRFRAHDESKCHGDHGADAKYWPENCLLDPVRLSWADLETEQSNGLGTFLTVYQQEDSDPERMLVQPLWVHGGTDQATGEHFVGCWDNDRDLCQMPTGLKGPLLSVASIDPSPTQYWGVTWWLIDTDPDSDRRYLLDLERRRMSTADALDWNNPQHTYTGLMEDWQQRSVELGRPITHWVYEANAAQRDFLTGERFANWKSTRNVSVLPHQTSKTKQDPKFGVDRLGPLYKFGKVRLPGAPGARATAMHLVNEVTRYPDGAYFDLGMSEWFVEVALPKIKPRSSRGLPLLPRASWQRRSSRPLAGDRP